MRVAYFDLGLSREEYTLQPRHYGGGAVAARYLKESDVDFHIFAPPDAFDNVGVDERRDRCNPLPYEVCKWLAEGGSLDKVWPNGAAGFPFDLILHPHTCATINRGSYRGPVCHFCGFDGSAGHPGNDYVLLYDKTFRAQFGECAKYVRIGKPVPAQCPEKPSAFSSAEQPFLFQVSRHDDHMGSIAIAKACLEAGIPGVFAGPIHHDYPLRDYIDGKTTTYLGEIDEQTKMDLHRRARLGVLCADWDLPFSQTLIEAQGQGTPIYVNRRGPFLKTYLKDGVNGFDAAGCSLREAFERAPLIDPQECWASAKAYDVPVMVESFRRAFNEIVAEWRATHP
jgi:hypothetical protein